MATLKQIRNESLSGRVYEELADAIKRGVFLPGEKLKIRALAQALGTSPTPVRDAIMRLAAQGIVHLSQSSGTARIPELSWGAVEQVYAVRMQLEGMAVEASTPLLDDSAIQLLGSLQQRMISASDQRRRQQVLELNASFHFTIYEATGNGVLLDIIENLWLISGPFINYALKEIPSHFATHHEQIIAAIRERDSIRARQAMEADLLATMNELRGHIESVPAGSSVD